MGRPIDDKEGAITGYYRHTGGFDRDHHSQRPRSPFSKRDAIILEEMTSGAIHVLKDAFGYPPSKGDELAT